MHINRPRREQLPSDDRTSSRCVYMLSQFLMGRLPASRRDIFFFFVFDFSAPDLSIFMCPTFRALVLSKLLRVTERFTELDPGLKESAVLHSPASSFPETFSIFSFRTVALFTQAQECSWKL